MSILIKTDSFIFESLDWDSEFFKVFCAKATLLLPLSAEDWTKLSSEFQEYEFICIQNCNSEPENAKKIGMDTSAFVTDINIQFEKELHGSAEMVDAHISIGNCKEYDENLLKIVHFTHSRFIEDRQLYSLGGKHLHRQWVENSFLKENKYFAIFRDNENQPIGFLLFSFNHSKCIVELINVNQEETGQGIGKKLFLAVEGYAYDNGCTGLKVGTQIRNNTAMNFYNKLGCRQTACHQIYHLWNKL